MNPWTGMSLLCLLGLCIVAGTTALRRDPAIADQVAHPNGARLPVYFAHADHVDQSCVSCHHNYTDDSGQGLCFDCHVTDPNVAPLIETQFHDLCRGCHADEQAAGEAHGPTRDCIACHQFEDLP